VAPNILIVEDDVVSAKSLSGILAASGFVTTQVIDGAEALAVTSSRKFDVILLDIMLPGMSGFDVLRSLRQAGKFVPVVFISGKSDLEDRIHGLELGADAFIAKPFAGREVVAVIKSVLRRVDGALEVLRVGDLSIDFVNHSAKRADKKLDLTPKEFQLLGLLARNLDVPLTREQINEYVWESTVLSQTNVVDVHIRRLRSKVDDPFTGKLIHTVRGVGYLLSQHAPKIEKHE
jgi:two-component system copper resistance phosphate regulon response regulator CusR